MNSICVFSVLMFTSSVNALFSIPGNVYFDINNYYDSTCNNTTDYSTELTFYCSNEDDINGMPSCCYDIIEQFAPFYNPQFNKCYELTVNNKTNYIDYGCRSADIGSLTSMQVLAIIGVLFLLLFVVGFIALISKIMCGACQKSSYNSI